MRDRDYRAIWESISVGSKEAIVGDVLRACSAQKQSCDRDRLRAEFEKGGPDAVIYWVNYLALFDPDTILRDSTWKLGEAGTDRAQIVLRHRDADRDTILVIVREDGAWKTGLEESFGVRKWLQRMP